MFEKEAEKIAERKISNFIPQKWGVSLIRTEPTWETVEGVPHFYLNSLAKMWQEGAEFGYSKANEWHKPSKKLPEECSLVLAYSFDDTEPSLWKFVTSDQWEWLPKRIVFCSNNQIRLWKEIVLPKEIE